MHDPLWIRILLALHIGGGFLAFVIAPVALFSAKGGATHRRWGKVYFWAMAEVAASALVLACYRPILFLALVAVFSFYSAFMGYRVLKMKHIARREDEVTAVDWVMGSGTFVASFALAVISIFEPEWIQNRAIPGIVFGLIGMSLSGQTLWTFVRPPQEKMFWWYTHLQGMIGSYIAAWTAFSVVTLGRLIHGGWVLWILPTAIGLPAISITTAYYKTKFGRRRSPAIAA